MTYVFNQVETTNLFTTIQQYNELPSNTFSIKLWYEDNKFSELKESKCGVTISFDEIKNQNQNLNIVMNYM